MKIKKANAAVGLLIIALLLVHVGYEVYMYLAFKYDPVTTAVIGYGFGALVMVHVVLSVYSVMKLHDGSRLRTYAKLNARTIVQRLSAAGILLLLPLHIKTGDWVASKTGGLAFFAFLMIAGVLFHAMLFLHIASSFSRALITLGLLESRKTQRILDVLAAVLCAGAFLYASSVIIPTQMFLFSM